MSIIHFAPAWSRFNTHGLRHRYILAFILALVATYLVVVNPWMMSWGATPEERQMALPGDEFGQGKPVQLTRAITVNAPPDKIWPWLLQVGQDRAGFYSYEWLENLASADMPTVNEIRPEWQQRAIGDKVPMARPTILGGQLGDAIYLPVNVVEPGRALSLTGVWVLLPIDATTTRVVVREYGGSSLPKDPAALLGAAFGRLVYDPMHFVMQRQMLRGVKAHAEGNLSPPTALSSAANIGWWAAGLTLTALFVARRRWWLGLVLPLALVYVTIWKTGDWGAALAGYLALGISLFGFFAFGRRWLMPFALVAAFVLLVLLFAPDAWIAFGLIFLTLGLVLAGAGLSRLQQLASHAPGTATIGRFTGK